MTKATVSKRRSEIVLPVIVGFVLRLAMVPFAHLVHPKLWEYGDIARLMIHGHGYSYEWSYRGIDLIAPSAYMLPGQVMVQYLGLWLLGDTMAGHAFIFLEDVVMGTIFVFAMWKLLRVLFHHERIVRLGTWLAAMYPSFVFAVSSFGVSSAVLTIDAFFLWSLLELANRIRSGKPALWMGLAAGVFAGLITQFRSESYPLLAISFLIIAWRVRKLPRMIPSMSIALLGFVVVITPWIARNYVVFHRVIPTSTNGGFNFWRGHNPDATGSSWDANGEAIWTTGTMWNAMEPIARPDTDVEFTLSRYHLDKAKAWIAAHPGMEVAMALKKIALLWTIDWYSKEARQPAYIALYALTLLCFIAGLIRAHREKLRHAPTARDAMDIIALWCVFYTLIVIVFFSLPRLQVILIGFYFPMVVYGADWIIDHAVQFVAAKAGWYRK